MNSTTDPHPLTARTTFAMATCCGIAVANIYYNQPMLALIAAQLGSRVAGLIPTATQLGYACGLLLLVPLGDILERRRVIVAQFVVLAIALIATAMSPNAATLLGASFLVGVFSTVAQQIVPFAALLSAPGARGRTIGRVMSGLLCGILFSRVLSGYVASHWGWREMFWIGVPLALVGALTMALSLPRSRPSAVVGYPRLLASLAHLWIAQPTLRRATLTQACLFASFIAFWTILSLHLAEPSLGYGATAAGLFGVIGAVGVFAAPLAGQIADRRGPSLVIAVGAAITAASWILFAAWPGVTGLVIGVVLLDFGVQSALVSNQHVVYALDDEARSRLNTVFMCGMFIGGSAGSAAANWAWHHAVWPGTCVAGVAFALIALLVQGMAHIARKD